MTLTDLEDKVNNNEESVVEVGQVLVEVIKQALSQERITLGIFECVDVLETSPEHVMLCVLPYVSDADTLVNIQHKLIEAYCWENAVNLVKVDSSEKLVALLSENSAVDRTMDFSCVLIGFPTDDLSSEDLQISKVSSYLFQEHETAPIVLPG